MAAAQIISILRDALATLALLRMRRVEFIQAKDSPHGEEPERSEGVSNHAAEHFDCIISFTDKRIFVRIGYQKVIEIK